MVTEGGPEREEIVVSDEVREQPFICVTCGMQYPPSATLPDGCPCCLDDRQYVHFERGQQWTTLEQLRGNHHNKFVPIEPGVTAIATEPQLGIGQQAYLIETPAGNYLWDLVAYVDETTIAEIQRRGGVTGIGISHPHYYTTLVEWSRLLGGVPVHLHESDREWVQRPDDAVRFWSGDTLEVGAGMTLVRIGGHFPGGTVLHWDKSGVAEADRAGVLFSGDIVSVVADRSWVTFMYSYPNQIPLDADSVRRMARMLSGYRYERLRDAFDRHVVSDAFASVQRSAERYVAHVEGKAGPTI